MEKNMDVLVSRDAMICHALGGSEREKYLMQQVEKLSFELKVRKSMCDEMEQTLLHLRTSCGTAEQHLQTHDNAVLTMQRQLSGANEKIEELTHEISELQLIHQSLSEEIASLRCELFNATLRERQLRNTLETEHQIQALHLIVEMVMDLCKRLKEGTALPHCQKILALNNTAKTMVQTLQTLSNDVLSIHITSTKDASCDSVNHQTSKTKALVMSQESSDLQLAKLKRPQASISTENYRLSASPPSCNTTTQAHLTSSFRETDSEDHPLNTLNTTELKRITPQESPTDELLQHSRVHQMTQDYVSPGQPEILEVPKNPTPIPTFSSHESSIHDQNKAFYQRQSREFLILQKKKKKCTSSSTKVQTDRHLTPEESTTGSKPKRRISSQSMSRVKGQTMRFPKVKSYFTRRPLTSRLV